MRSLIGCMLVLAASPHVHAQGDLGPAARAKAIAPFVEEETALVVHVDLSRMASQPTFGLLSQVLSFAPVDMYSDKVAAIFDAGVKDLYLVAPPTALISERPKMYFVAPVSSGEQEKALRTALRLRSDEGQTVHGALVVAWPRLKQFRPVERPELAAAFEAAGDTAAQVILIPPADTRRVIDELMPQLPKELGGGPSSVLTRGVRWAALGIDATPRSLRLVIQSESHGAAETLHAKLAELLKVAGQQPAICQKLPQFDAIANSLLPRVDGDRLILTSEEKKPEFESVWAALVRPIQEMQAKAASINNLKQIGLAMLNYESANKHFPLPASVNAAGKPLLSWRMLILPYLEQDALYSQFHLDEPWDSAHNRTLIDKMPSVYRLPISKSERGRTNYLLPVGNGAAFSADQPTEFKQITDGTSNTIMVVEVDDEHAAIWTKPDDLPFDPKEPAKGLGRFFDGGFNATFCDGSVHSFRTAPDRETLRRLFLRTDGQPIQR